ncbi:MAG: YbjN domain-containing protein [Alphaproteobacteria bacterium]|nr:YbjN domain-containing protein [Alphaproteobacteria bacterium]
MPDKRLAALAATVEGYLEQMGLPNQPSEDHLYMFRRGSTAIVVSLFMDEDARHTFVRFTAPTLSDFEPTLDLVREILRLNAEVLFGAFILFDENTLCFSATLLGDKLDFEEFETALSYVAQVSDDYDDMLQDLAGGHRVADLLKEFDG